MTATVSQSDPHTMRCLEVWGGNQAVDNGVVMAGLDAWLYSRPFQDQSAGGDLHYVSSCAAGLLTRVLVADVSGHGEVVAETAHELRRLMRRYVNYVDQTRFVQELNVEFAALSQAGGFATAAVATYLAPTDEFTLCNAGHPRPLWYRARTGTWSVMADANSEAAPPSAATTAAPQMPAGPRNIPLGIAEPACYDQFSIKLATGDLVVLYTDSLIEALGADGRSLGQEGLLRLAGELDPSEPREFLHRLLEEISRYGDPQAGGDDVTVLILRPNGLKPRVSMGTHLKSMARLVGAMFASLRPGGPDFPGPEDGAFAKVDRILNGPSSRRRPQQQRLKN